MIDVTSHRGLGLSQSEVLCYEAISKGGKKDERRISIFIPLRLQNLTQLSKVNKHNLRDYDNKKELIKTIYGTNDIVNDVKQLYLDEFEQSKLEYNSKQTREDRKINNYFKHISDSKLWDLACEIIIELGDMDFWDDKDKEYRLKMIDVYNEQVNDLIKTVPTFKIANATIHFDETSPHMHVVGVPVIENCKRGMKKQVGKSKLFTKTSLTEIQDKMRSSCIKSFNKFYDMNFKLKEKQKGRNQDINVKDMDNYKKIKKQLEQNTKRLEKANIKYKNLDNHANKVSEILSKLKPSKINKNNMIISNENVAEIQKLTEEIKDNTNSFISANKLNIMTKDFEHSIYEIEHENHSLKYQLELKDKEINHLKNEISIKDRIIGKLRDEKDILKEI